MEIDLEKKFINSKKVIQEIKNLKIGIKLGLSKFFRKKNLKNCNKLICNKISNRGAKFYILKTSSFILNYIDKKLMSYEFSFSTIKFSSSLRYYLLIDLKKRKLKILKSLYLSKMGVTFRVIFGKIYISFLKKKGKEKILELIVNIKKNHLVWRKTYLGDQNL